MPSSFSLPKPSGSSLPIGTHRLSYPSGPWVDEHGRLARSPNQIPAPTPAARPTVPNPDPNNYKLVQVDEYKGYTIVKLRYPDCTNYEGNKILVFHAKLLDLVNQKSIDPHFFQDNRFHSPIARFVPTPEGWQMAVDFVQMIADRATAEPPKNIKIQSLHGPTKKR
jgi:hypothetical protein